MSNYEGDRHLVPLYPSPVAPGKCSVCESDDVQVNGTVFPGIHVMANVHCNQCGSDLLQDHPVGFALDYPMAINTKTKALVKAEKKLDWIHKPLITNYSAPSNDPVKVERKVHKEHRRVVILNTLDFLYGHVLLKLYNAAHYLERYPDLGLIVIVPRMFEWLVPKGTAEVWSVGLRLGQMHGWYPALDAFVQERLEQYDEVYLGRGYAHPEFATIDIERFTGVQPFPLQEFDERPPHITFVAREDRLWFATRPGKFIYRALGRLGPLKGLRRWFVGKQDRMIKRSMRAILERIPEAKFTVVGLAIPGGYGTMAEDLRTRNMNDSVEMAWVNAYAQSQVVVGVHGSNMLLPTAHAAGCVEILPDDRFGNIVQDISVRWHDRMQVFMYRFVDEFAPPRTVARHVTAMFSEFNNYHRNNRLNGFANER